MKRMCWTAGNIALVMVAALLAFPVAARQPPPPVPTEERLVATDIDRLSVIATFDETVDDATLESVTGGQVIYRFSTLFAGVSLVLAGDKVEALANVDGIKEVFLDQLLQPATEVSPGFIGAPVLWDQLGGQGSAGEGVIVGVLDSGIWPEHPSFSDPDPFGSPYASPPVAPGSNGFGSGGPRSTCDFGNTAWNANDATFPCNDKLIGAYQYLDTYKAVIGLLPSEFDSARDDNGHGTHTASTAAGNGGVATSIFGVSRGTVSGVAPRAHVIAYRVCADQGCFSSDSAAAVEQAILDEVDAINFSISGGENPYSDIVELMFAAAYDNGVFVAASAGNAGPTADTVDHRGPWTTTVAASTTDRHFLSTVTLQAGSATLQLQGASVTDGIATPTPVVLASDYGDGLCLNPFPANTFSGEIVVCQRGIIARTEKSFNVAEGGGGGLLLYNPTLQGVATDNHFIPSVHLENDAGANLLAFMGSHTGVMATFTAGTATPVQGDVMAAFSSRGGAEQTLGISKPDITAPGVQILAGHTPLPATIEGGSPGELFQSIQGTSMSSPHVAGSAALVKAAHPDWTPGQIKSALMMTAWDEVVKEDGFTAADPFDYGSGRVDLGRAANAGLTISDTTSGFLAHQEDLWNANYPSLYLPSMAGIVTVQRTARSERDKNTNWKLSVDSPPDLDVSVPKTLNVKAGQDHTFDITVDASRVPLGDVRHATLYFEHKDETLRFPITVVRRQPAITMEKSCTPDVLAVGETTDCTITLENTSLDDATVSLYDRMPPGLPMVIGSLSGADATGAAALSFEGTLDGAANAVDVTPTPSPFGFFPLASLGVTPFGCPSDCDDGGFILNVPPVQYLGQSYSQVIWSVNGTVELGTASGIAAPAINQALPDPILPNNVLAPWWTDLDLGAGGNWYVAVLTAGSTQWGVFEWENVPRYGDLSSTFSFQIWMQTVGGNAIHFVYGASAGDTVNGTVGAENADGSVGEAYYFDGAGTLPWGGSDLAVSATATPGETHVISYTATAEDTGPWTNCAELTSDRFQGTSTACVSGDRTP